jgi:hypothetical protein
MAGDKIAFRLGTQRHEDNLLRAFLSKFPQDRWNGLIKQIAVSAIEMQGVDWNPFLTGFVATPTPSTVPELSELPISKKVENAGISTLEGDLITDAKEEDRPTTMGSEKPALAIMPTPAGTSKPTPVGTKSLADILG